ncbi:alpha-amylase family glycosyl hydrolase [Bacillus cytotoxicus]|uniref:Alpha amylase catalytic region n=1 Tax=Bacillus cytotoxicus (strain DSM 22905 / CIP 110041 / 391-98 / NVH 391-98) TaxID=315749 RepID=A7GM52_BACCN|nr:alpha amylase catalytic region [Bacillus cytotoxicus NVH 391-98]
MKRIWRGTCTLICITICLIMPIQQSLAKEKREWQDEVVYSIMIDRFNNGDAKNDSGLNTENLEDYQGGDISGIIKRLDYIKDMGFTAIMLSPLSESKKYDGTGVGNLRQVNEHFGSLQDVRKLVQEAHKKEMKVIFQFIAGEEDSRQMVDVVKWWMQEVNIDGSYFIHSEKLSNDSLHDMKKQLKDIKKDFVVLTDEKESAHNDYYKAITNAFSKTDRSIQPLYHASLIEAEQVMNTYIDHQNTKRFVRLVKENGYYPPARLKLALAYLYTSPGLPIVYYGTEIALDGGDVPDNRRLMDFKTDEKFLRYITKLGELRKELPSLRRGTFELLHDEEGMSILKRTYKDEVTIIALNNTKVTKKVALPANIVGEKRQLRGLLEDEIIREEGGKYYLVLKREEANIYKAGEQTSINWVFVSMIVLVNLAFIVFLIAVKKRGKQV